MCTYHSLFSLPLRSYSSVFPYMQVISSMRVMMTEDSSNGVSSSFLLDDDSRYRFFFFFFRHHQNLNVWSLVKQLKMSFDSLPEYWNILCYCSIPFSVDDISKTMQTVDVADVEPPPLIRQNSGFVFLHQRSDQWYGTMRFGMVAFTHEATRRYVCVLDHCYYHYH